MAENTEEFQPSVHYTKKGEKILERYYHDDVSVGGEDNNSDGDSSFVTASSDMTDYSGGSIDSADWEEEVVEDPTDADWVIIHPDMIEGLLEHIEGHPDWQDFPWSWFPTKENPARLRGVVLERDYDNDQDDLVVQWMNPNKDFPVPSNLVRSLPKSFLLVVDRGVEEGDIITLPRSCWSHCALFNRHKMPIGIVTRVSVRHEVADLSRMYLKGLGLQEEASSANASTTNTSKEATTTRSAQHPKVKKLKVPLYIDIQKSDRFGGGAGGRMRGRSDWSSDDDYSSSGDDYSDHWSSNNEEEEDQEDEDEEDRYYKVPTMRSNKKKGVASKGKLDAKHNNNKKKNRHQEEKQQKEHAWGLRESRHAALEQLAEKYKHSKKIHSIVGFLTLVQFLRRHSRRKQKREAAALHLEMMASNRVLPMCPFSRGMAVRRIDPWATPLDISGEEAGAKALAQQSKTETRSQEEEEITNSEEKSTAGGEKQNEKRTKREQKKENEKICKIGGIYWVERVSYLYYFYFPRTKGICILYDHQIDNPAMGVYTLSYDRMRLKDGIWIRGSYQDLMVAHTKGNALASEQQQRSCVKKNSKKHPSSSKSKAPPPPPLTEEEEALLLPEVGVSFLWLPYSILIANHHMVTEEVHPTELLPLETMYSVTNRVGSFGFLEFPNDENGQEEEEDAEEGGQEDKADNDEKRDESASYSFPRNTTFTRFNNVEELYRWYQDLFPPEAPDLTHHPELLPLWQAHCHKIMTKYLPKLCRITGSRSAANVSWKDGRVLKHYASILCPTQRRMDEAGRMEFMPSDVVYSSCPGLIQIPACDDPLDVDHHAAPSTVTTVCSKMDIRHFYEEQCDIVVGDTVVPRQKGDIFQDEGRNLDDPDVLGVILKCDKVDTEKQCLVQWVRQPEKTIRRVGRGLLNDDEDGLVSDIPSLDADKKKETSSAGDGAKHHHHDGDDDTVIGPRPLGEAGLELEICHQMTGEIIAVLPDTRLQVLWASGKVELCWRHDLSVFRQFQPESEVDDQEDHAAEAGGTPISATQPDSPTHPNTLAEDSEERDPLVEHDNDPDGTQRQPKRAGFWSGVAGALTSLWGSGKNSTAGAGKFEEQNLLDEQTEDGTADSKKKPPVGDDKDDEPPEHTSTTATTTTTTATVSQDKPQEPPDDLIAPVFVLCSTFTRHKNTGRWKHQQPVKFTARVQQEWKQLKANLPPNIIFAKGAEDSMQLLKFCIIGPAHTPYYQAFFCFDLLLPEDYPNSPPKVHFHSKGFKMNPNLYEDGYICLSLLGTWQANNSCEGWNSKSSNLLQVILSIQGLVLVKEPYYNEAGYDKYIGTEHGRRESISYNETAYTLRLQHTLECAKYTPADWTYEFREHYKRTVTQVIERAKGMIAQHNNNKSGGGGVSPSSCSSSSPTSTTAATPTTTTTTTSPAAGDSSSRFKINLDGLIAPFSPGFIAAVQSRIVLLEQQYAELVPKWDEEAAKYDLPHLGD